MTLNTLLKVKEKLFTKYLAVIRFPAMLTPSLTITYNCSYLTASYPPPKHVRHEKRRQQAAVYTTAIIFSYSEAKLTMFEVYDGTRKKANYSNLRATDIPTVQRLFPPKTGTIQQELAMQNTREKMLRVIKEFKQKRCNNKGWLKKRNVTHDVFEGLKEIKEKVGKKEMVVFTTDKSGHLTADTVENYNLALAKHTKDDRVVTNKQVRDIELKMNQHLYQFNRMFRVGATWGHEERVTGASTSSNVPPPAAYGLRKDHKPVTPGQEHVGPDVRPIVGATEAPNSRFSHFLSKILCDYADSSENSHECLSSEEMRSAFEKFNDMDESTKKKCSIISMDVKSLYPSMGWDAMVTAVKEMIMDSKMIIENVDWREISKYIAVEISAEEIEAEGLTLVIPKRKGRPGRKRTINFLQTKKNDNKWTVARKPGVRQKQKMLALVISHGVKMVMSHHTYKVGDLCHLQAKGGAIGLELTGAVSRPFMWKWDQVYLRKVRQAGLVMHMYERYIDDR